MNLANSLSQKSKEELIKDLLLLQTDNEKINAELMERTKELQAVYKISTLLQEPELSLDIFFQKVVELIPPGWQFPKITCARIIFGEQEYKTSNFKISKWKQAEIIQNKKVANAVIEVYYLVEKPTADEGPFLKEERNLLRVFANNLSRIVETNFLINELEDSEGKFIISFQKSPVAKCLVDKSDNFKLLDVNEAFLSLTGFSRDELENRYLQDINFISKELINSVLIPKIKKDKNIKDFELTVKNRNGESKTGLINIVTIFLKSKEVVLVAISDISEQKKNHDKIIESEKRLQSIFENMQDAYFQVDLDGNFSYFNPMALQMYRYDSEKELLGKPSTILYTNISEREELLNKLQETGKVKDFTGKALRKDGTTFWASMNVHFIYDNKGNIAGTEGVVRDITERLNAERKIQESEKKFRDIFENMPSGYVLLELVYNEKGQPVDHRMLEANAQFDNQTGLKRKDLIGRKMMGGPFSLPEDIARKYYEVALTGEPFSYERFNESLNRYFDIRVSSPQKGQFSLLFNDITKRKKSEQKILELLNRFKQIAQHLPGFIYQYHLRNDNTSYFPYVSEGVFGVSPEEAYKNAQNVFDVIHPDDMDRVSESIHESAKNMTVWNESFRVILPTGEMIWAEGKSTPIKMDDGSVLWHGFILDITVRKKQENELIKNRKLLKRSQRAGKIGSWEFNVEDKSLVWEEETYNIFGYHYEDHELNNSAFLQDIIHPDDREYVSMIRKKIEKEKRFTDHEYRIILKNGEERYIHVMGDVDLDNEGNVVRTYGITQDITERKKQEQELLRSRKLLKRAQRAGKIGSWEFNLEENKLVFEEETYNIFGYSYDANEINNIAFLRDIVHPDDQKHVVRIRKQIEEKKKFIDHEYRIIRKDGKERHVLIMGDVVLNKEGNVVRTYGIIQDITERKKQEQELIKAKDRAEENEKRLSAFKSSSTEGIFFLKKDIITDANETACLMFDYTLEELIGMSAAELTAEESKETVKGNIKAGSETAYDIVALRKDKSTFIGEVRGKMFDYNGEKIRVSALRDITERNEQEQELLIQQKLLLESQRIAKVGSWEMDLKSLELKWSEELYRIYEIDDNSKVPVLDDFINLVHPDDRIIIQRNLDDIFNIKIFNEFECRVITTLGSTKYISVSGEIIFDKTGKPSHLYGIVQDTTRQKIYENQLIKAREKAEESEKKLLVAQDLAKLGSWELDVESQTFTFSDNLLKIYHTSAEEMGGYQIPLMKYAKEFVHPEDADIVAVESGKAITTNDPNFTNYLEHKINYLDGGIGYIAVRYFVIKDENGKTVKTFGVNQDITEKKNAEIELIKAKERAEESDRLKTAFLMNVSHEIRTPMNGILGFTSLLEDPDLSEEEKSSFIQIINKSGERLMNTINDIVEISKIEIGDVELHIESINPSEIMQYHYDFFSPEIKEKGLDFELKNQVTELIKTDKHKLDGILMNLLKNAIKFTTEGKIEFGNYIQGSNICFFVSDTGVGIPEDKQRVIFTRFVQADTELTSGYEGSGIGLAIVKSYVESLNGTIEVKSDVKKGSIFTVSIPFTEEKETHKKNDKKIENIEFDKKPTVLVAEDDEVNFIYLKNILSDDFRIIHAKNGEEAVRLYHENPDISAVLMDIKMPGEYDGVEAIRRIKSINKNALIIAQTAFAMDVDKKKAFDAGCDGYITKPFKRGELISSLKKELNKKN
ncbi:PAS domain S-box protein [Saccharicrinis sp. FJH2]|uniref:PAS domain S-box protein n=1 Tax=Saccharicrinis sp. FJH65 TaxID=3344659 RepID=UPI0035F3311E